MAGWSECQDRGVCPLWSMPCPSFFLHLIPLTPSPGWLGARQRRGEQLPGISRASRGRWEPPLPTSFHSPLLLSSCHLFPAPTFPSSLLLSPPLILPEGQRDWEEMEQILLHAGMCMGQVVGDRVQLACGRSDAGQLLAAVKSPHLEP